MAGSIHTEIAPGQILSDEGAELFRRVLQGGAILRCAHLWMAQAHPTNGGEIEIELYCHFDQHRDHWEIEVYYYNLSRAIAALREYEQTGNMPEGE